eukprot:gene56778-biopygen72329
MDRVHDAPSANVTLPVYGAPPDVVVPSSQHLPGAAVTGTLDGVPGVCGCGLVTLSTCPSSGTMTGPVVGNGGDTAIDAPCSNDDVPSPGSATLQVTGPGASGTSSLEHGASIAVSPPLPTTGPVIVPEDGHVDNVTSPQPHSRGLNFSFGTVMTKS